MQHSHQQVSKKIFNNWSVNTLTSMSMKKEEEHLEEEQPLAKKSQNDDSKRKSKLHDDILIMMVEKVFFQGPEEDGNNIIDLSKGNQYTFFMAHKPITETAFITQFAKLRRVEFQNDRGIEFHKDEEKSTVVNQNGLFTGPWRVSNLLLEEIINRKKFRVTNVYTWLYLGDREACDLGTNASSLEAFCTLFLGKKLDIPDSMKNEYDLAINKLEINENSDDIKKNFEAIHAINSKELDMYACDEDLFSFFCSSLPRSQITADKTIKITIESFVDVDFDKFVCNSTMNYANFVFETCPNLVTLNFELLSMPDEMNAKNYLDKLNTILSSFMDQFLKPLDKGHSELKICVTWTGIGELRNDQVYPQDHVLFTIGTKYTTETKDDFIVEPDIARIIKVADAKGREHECILAIHILDIDEGMSESDSNQESSDDNNDEDSADFDDYSDNDDVSEEEEKEEME